MVPALRNGFGNTEPSQVDPPREEDECERRPKRTLAVPPTATIHGVSAGANRVRNTQAKPIQTAQTSMMPSQTRSTTIVPNEVKQLC